MPSSFAERYRLAQDDMLGFCPVEAGTLGRLADRECEHGRLPGDRGEPCGCWPVPPNALKRRRLMLGFTRARLAAESGICIATIQRLESGERPIWESASKLAFALACEPQWLFPGEPRALPPVSRRAAGELLRQRAFQLKARGWSQRRIGAELHVHESTVSRWMQGR